jgi:hypothetical protein
LQKCPHKTRFGDHKRTSTLNRRLKFNSRSHRYNSAIRQRLPHAPYLTTRIVKQSSFWNQERKKYVGLNDAKSSFKHGAIVKLIIANRGVWADRRYATSQWVLVQVLLVHPAFDPSNEFMITDTPESSE